MQLYEKVGKLYPTIRLATILETLPLLKMQGEVMEIDLGEAV